MASKFKKKLKKIAKVAGKAALIGGALYAGAKGLKARGLKGNAKKLREGDIGIGQRAPRVDDYNYIPKPKKWDIPHDKVFGDGIGIAKGGRVGAKHGGRTGKQFGGGLNRPVASTARRDMRSGYYPNDMGMRGGTMYKKGGRVKSMGVAKRGGGAAKR